MPKRQVAIKGWTRPVGPAPSGQVYADPTSRCWPCFRVVPRRGLDAHQPHPWAAARGAGESDIDPVDRFLRTPCPQRDRRLHAGGPGAHLVVLGEHAVGPCGASLDGSRVGVLKVEAGPGEERAELPGNQVQVTSLLWPAALGSATAMCGSGLLTLHGGPGTAGCRRTLSRDGRRRRGTVRAWPLPGWWLRRRAGATRPGPAGHGPVARSSGDSLAAGPPQPEQHAGSGDPPRRDPASAGRWPDAPPRATPPRPGTSSCR